jgi:hypothetical protein
MEGCEEGIAVLAVGDEQGREGKTPQQQSVWAARAAPSAKSTDHQVGHERVIR